jgi:hypothetical protein
MIKEMNVNAVRAVLIALYGPTAPDDFFGAYEVARHALDEAYDIGYEAGFEDADPDGAYQRGVRDTIAKRSWGGE